MFSTLCGQHFVIDFSFKYSVFHNCLILSAKIHENSRFPKCFWQKCSRFLKCCLVCSVPVCLFVENKLLDNPTQTISVYMSCRKQIESMKQAAPVCLFPKSLDFYGINSKKVLFFMDLIPKKYCFWEEISIKCIHFCTIVTLAHTSMMC